jgi:hypothetical protein
VVFDSDCGGEFINHEVADWLQARDIAQTRSRPYQKNDQAHVGVGWPEGVSPSGSHRSVREPLSSYGSCHLDHQTAGTAVVQAQCAKYRGYASATRRHAWWTSRRPLNRRYFLRTQRIR